MCVSGVDVCVCLIASVPTALFIVIVLFATCVVTSVVVIPCDAADWSCC